MDTEQVRALLRDGLPDCDVQVQGDGSHFDIVLVGARFEGLTPVRRQQAVYSVLGPTIRSGAIHAVNIRALTPAEAG